MRNKYIPVSCGIIVMLLALSLAPIQPAKAQFVISGSGYPDAYGQGIEVLWLWANSTGSFLKIYDVAFLIFPASNDATNLEMNWTANTAIKLAVGVNINHSLLGLSTHQEALDIMRTNISVMSGGSSVFSKANLTWGGGTVWNDTVTTWQFTYEVVINILITQGFIYSILITYEVFY